MDHKITELAEKIKSLVDEMSLLARGKAVKKKTLAKEPLKTKGAAGALNILISEGFFDRPKYLGEVIAKMKDMERYYSKNLISTNLLNLTKRRVLNRFKGKASKNWQYVLRK